MRKLFIPGFGASGRLYAAGLGPEWEALEPPSFHATGGALSRYREWLAAEVDRADAPVWLAGHSMGGALAVFAAASEPERVARLTLVCPSGLPLHKPITASLALFVRQVAGGRYEAREIAREIGSALAAPRAALRLAHAVRALDLTREMRRVRGSGIPAEVIACTTDTLVTPAHCRTAAKLLGADYRELALDGGHMWMLTSWPKFARLF